MRCQLPDQVFSVWEGIFSSFSEAGGDFDAFDGPRWLEKQSLKIRNIAEEYKSNRTFQCTGVSQDYSLPLVAAVMIAQQRTLDILDFGGSLGAQFFELLSKVPLKESQLIYRVLDGKALIESRPSVLNQFSNLLFSSSLMEVPQTYNILNLNSVIQYIDDWQGLLSSIVHQDLEYAVFSDILAGEVPGFVTLQQHYEKKIPVRMLNVHELISLMDKLGQKLIYKSFYNGNILNQDNLPNSALPPEYQLKKSLNLVFARK